jgi:chromosome segregation ATPase
MGDNMNQDTLTISIAGLSTLISSLYPLYKGLSEKEQRITKLEQEIKQLTDRQQHIDQELRTMDVKQDKLVSEISDIKVLLGRIEERLVNLQSKKTV